MLLVAVFFFLFFWLIRNYFFSLLEQFEVHSDLLKYVIGKKGKNIREAKSIPGVTYIALLKDTNTIKIYAQVHLVIVVYYNKYLILIS